MPFNTTVTSTVPVFSGDVFDGGDDADDDDPLPAGPFGGLPALELTLELALGRVATLLIGGHALVLPHSPRMAGTGEHHPVRESR